MPTPTQKIAQVIEEEKRCWKCKETKPIALFYNDRTRYDGIDHACKKCVNARRDAQRKKIGFYGSDVCKARMAVRKAKLNGSLKKLPCEECGDVKSMAHHTHGYSEKNWLKVKWLCSKHHVLIHKLPTTGENKE